MPPKRKRAPVATKPPAKRGKSVAKPISAVTSRRLPVIKEDPDLVMEQHSNTSEQQDRLRARFIALFSEKEQEVSNGALKAKFGDEYLALVPIINELTRQSRLVMSKVGEELYYTLVSDEMASKFAGLDMTARMVYQIVERAGNMGIWTKDIRTQSNMQQQALNKIFKVKRRAMNVYSQLIVPLSLTVLSPMLVRQALETRRLIKPVKSVNAQAKKLYMLYNLTPAKELTGGPWYSDLEFDHEFISELRTFFMHCVRRMNGGRGVTLSELKDAMVKAEVSRVQLSLDEVQQLMQTLVYDHLVETGTEDDRGNTLFVAARRVTPMCEFKWWDVLSPDFHFLDIHFEDSVTLTAHEPHHHTA